MMYKLRAEANFISKRLNLPSIIQGDTPTKILLPNPQAMESSSLCICITDV